MTTAKLRGLDLFSGIGGISLALQPWVETVAYCEIEPYCQAVLLERMQSGDLDIAPIWPDVTTLNREVLDTQLDIIFGGFPCQDISVAGKQLGIKSDTRSGLFFHVMRLVKEYQPQYVFLENVAAICNSGLDLILREIAEAGYDAKWRCLSARDTGSPHNRERWWMLAYRKDIEKKISKIESSEWANQWPAGRGLPQFEWEPARVIVADTEHVRRNGVEIKASNDSDVQRSEERAFCAVQSEGISASCVLPGEPKRDGISAAKSCFESELGGGFNGLSFRMDRIKALGNSVVPQTARAAFETLIA
jgi:DNA (cytosine-5)-methyltransferase 1